VIFCADQCRHGLRVSADRLRRKKPQALPWKSDHTDLLWRFPAPRQPIYRQCSMTSREMGVCVAYPREGRPCTAPESGAVDACDWTASSPRHSMCPRASATSSGAGMQAVGAWRIYTLYASFGLTYLTAPHSTVPISIPQSPLNTYRYSNNSELLFSIILLFVSLCQDFSDFNHSIDSKHWLRCSPSLLVFRCTWPALDLILLHRLQHSSFIITPHSVCNYGTDCHCGD